MRSKLLHLAILFLLSIIAISCTLSLQTTSDLPNIQSTMTAFALYQTQVSLRQTMESLSPSSTPNMITTTPPHFEITMTAFSLQQTQTALQQTLHPPPSPTSQPTHPPSTNVQGIAQGNLNCRTGPAPYYYTVYSLKKGDVVQVLARSSEEGNEYWRVRTPQGKTCWVWGRWLSIQGNAAQLPVLPPPPPPPGAFSIQLLRQDSCNGNRFLVFRVTNKGPTTLESIEIFVQERLHGHWYSNHVSPAYVSGFYRCGGSMNSLKPEATTEVWVPIFAANLQGVTILVSSKACTKDSLKGKCFQRTTFSVQVP